MAFKTNAILKRLYLNRGVQSIKFNSKTDKFVSNLKVKKVLNNFLRRINLIPTQIQIKSSNYNLTNYWFIFVRYKKKILKLKVKDYIYKLWLNKKELKRRKNKKYTTKKPLFCFLGNKNKYEKREYDLMWNKQKKKFNIINNWVKKKNEH